MTITSVLAQRVLSHVWGPGHTGRICFWYKCNAAVYLNIPVGLDYFFCLHTYCSRFTLDMMRLIWSLCIQRHFLTLKNGSIVVLTFNLPTFSLGMRPPVLLFPSILFCSSMFLFLYFLQQEQTSSSLISGESNCAWQLSCLRECLVFFLFFFFKYILKLFPHICAKVYARRSAASCRRVFHRNLLIWDGCANDSQRCVGIMTWEKPNEKQLSWKQEMATDDIRSRMIWKIIKEEKNT